LIPVETTDPTAEATALSVAAFTLALAALTPEVRLDKAVDRSSIWVEYWPFASVLSLLRGGQQRHGNHARRREPTTARSHHLCRMQYPGTCRVTRTE
jgi:hypothetical protein